jgi:hypothetical protein
MAKPRSFKLYGLGAVALLTIVPAWMWSENKKKAKVVDASNYTLEYPKPDGWVEYPAGMQTLFIYKHPKLKITLRGSQSQIVSDENPTPELDRDGLTEQFADVTRDNLGWKADVLGTVDCKGSSFRLIRRETVDRTVITGIAVRGNTTILITLIGVGEGQKNVDGTLPMFKTFLADTSLDLPKVYD